MEKTRVEKNNTEQKGIEQINEVSLKRNRMDKNIIEQTKNIIRKEQIRQNRIEKYAKVWNRQKKSRITKNREE